jgi:hypothetical protein
MSEVNYYLYEEDPPQSVTKKGELVWKQGYFPFGSQSRIANITAIKFITSDLVVVAHRAVAKLYLLKIEETMCEIIDSITVKKNGKYYHPDGMALLNNKLYITAFTADIPVVEILPNMTLKMDEIIKMNSHKMPYHGIYINPDHQFFGGCSSINNETCIDYLTNTQKKIRFMTGFDRRIKGIDMIDVVPNTLIVGSDNKTLKSKDLFDSFVHTYSVDFKNQKLIHADDLRLPSSQIDGIVLNQKTMKWYATIHNGIDQCGYIVVGSVSQDKNLSLALLSKYRCDDFPHGIDLNNGNLSFTCYGTSSFAVVREKKVIEKLST